MNLLIDWLRRWARLLTSERQALGLFGRLWRTVLLVPPFGALIVLLRLRLLLRGPVVVTATTRDGARLRCRPPDLIQTYITLFGVWEPDLSALIEERLRPGDVFVDVGANIGYFSVMAGRRVGATGSVVAIDALPSIFDELQHNLQLNGIADRTRAVNRAVSDRAGEVRIHAGPAHNRGLATTVPNTRAHFEQVVTVPSAPLSELLTPEEMRRCRLVKIDVEGGEPAVLAGLTGFLRQCSPDAEFLLELSPAWWPDASLTPEDAIKPLRDAGFKTYVMDNNYWPWRYLWPRAVRRPRRVARLPDRRVKRIDLFLSRVDAPELPRAAG